MRLLFFDSFKLGVLRGDMVVDVSSAVADIPQTHPQDVIRGVIEGWSEYRPILDEAAARGPGISLASVRIRPPLPAAAFSLGYLADEAAYGAGVYRGVLREKLLSPLLPAVAWRPLGKAPAATRPGVRPGKDPLP